MPQLNLKHFEIRRLLQLRNVMFERRGETVRACLRRCHGARAYRTYEWAYHTLLTPLHTWTMYFGKLWKRIKSWTHTHQSTNQPSGCGRVPLSADYYWHNIEFSNHLPIPLTAEVHLFVLLSLHFNQTLILSRRPGEWSHQQSEGQDGEVLISMGLPDLTG